MANFTGYLTDKDGNKLFLDNNYSTDEQVIGEWMGKPLYRKAGSYTTNTTISNAGYTIIMNIPNLKMIIKCGGAFRMNNNLTYQPLPYNSYSNHSIVVNNAQNYYIDAGTNGDIAIIWQRGSSLGSGTLNEAYVWVEYTKTTD